MIVKARLHLAHIFAEAQHHSDLVGLDAEETRKAPQRNGSERDQHNAPAAEISRNKAAQPVLAAAQKFFKIGRSRALLLRTRAPGSPRPRTPRATGLIAPRHQFSPERRRAGCVARAAPGSPGYRGVPGPMQRKVT